MTSAWVQGHDRRPLLVAVLLVSLGLSGCALRQPRAQDFGIPVCQKSAEGDFLAAEALQCWFTAAYGRWRTLGHQSHLEALVVEVEAMDLRDAGAIARRFVDNQRAFSEVLVYVQSAGDAPTVEVRRVRWVRGAGFDTLEYTTPPGNAPLTVRSLP